MAFARRALQAFFPLDDQLALLSGHLTPQLHAWLVGLATSMPFAAASSLLLDLVRVPVSTATTRRLTQTAGSLLVAAQTSHASDLLSACRLVEGSSQTLLLSADGAMVALVKGEWAEVKTLVIGDIPAAVAADTAVLRTQARSYLSRLCDATTFGTLALPQLHRRRVSSAAQVVAVTDRAQWLQRFVDLHRSDAIRI
jgi:hypothetical protein